MRRDIHVPNESDGFVFTSAALQAKGLSPGDSGWAAAITACDLLALSVESEDSANVRVVVGESLHTHEQAEWVGVVRSGLRVPDGRLALSGGIGYVLERAPWAEEFARVVDIPAGDYRATLYCYASAANGRLCLERAGCDEALGAWFRRTRPGQSMPTWLHNLCVNDPGLDPGHEKQWRKAKEKFVGSVIDFLLHLEPANDRLASAPVTADGFAEAQECRKPALFPLGIAVVGLEGGGEENAQPPTEPVTTIAAPTVRGELVPLAGGPVGVPIAKLARLGQIAWMCHPYTHPALRITFNGKAPQLGLDDIEDTIVVISGNELRINFHSNGQPADALRPLTAVAAQLSVLADGAVLEFHRSRLKTQSELGAHRYVGTVRQGVWQVETAFPRVDAACLVEALALVESLENGRRLTARDEDEAIRIDTRVRSALADYFGANALQRTGRELALRRRDPTLFAHVVARVFWSRYANTWPLQDEDADTLKGGHHTGDRNR